MRPEGQLEAERRKGGVVGKGEVGWVILGGGAWVVELRKDRRKCDAGMCGGKK